MMDNPKQLAYALDGGYFAIFASSEGYDYSFYDASYNQLDGGVYDDPTVTIYEAIEEIAQDELTVLSPQLGNYKDLPTVDFEDLTEQAEAVEMEKIQQHIATLPNPGRGTITEKSDRIKVDGHMGTWYVVDTEEVNGQKYFLLEHEEYGDEAACVIVDKDGKLTLEDVWNGFDDLEEYFDGQEKAPIVEPNFEMPDPTVTVADAHEYGYTAPELLPISHQRGEEFFLKDFPIYALYEDNTEAAVCTFEDLERHQGLYGIEVVDWLAYLELKQARKILQCLQPAMLSTEQNQIDGICNNVATLKEKPSILARLQANETNSQRIMTYAKKEGNER